MGPAADGVTGAKGDTGDVIGRSIPQNNTATTLDSTGDVGFHTSVATGSDGLELISYYDDTNADLKVAHCSNQFCPPIFQEKIGVFAKLTILSNERNKLTKWQ